MKKISSSIIFLSILTYTNAYCNGISPVYGDGLSGEDVEFFDSIGADDLFVDPNAQAMTKINMEKCVTDYQKIHQYKPSTITVQECVILEENIESLKK